MIKAQNEHSSYDIDNVDRLILQTLQSDGRTSFTEIARQVGVSETTIRNRYQNLVDKGVVHTVGIVDPAVLGFQAPALINVKVSPGKADFVAHQIAELPEVSYLIMTLGSFDLNVEVLCKDLTHLTELITQRIQTIPHIQSTEMLMISHSYKLSYRWSPILEMEE